MNKEQVRQDLINEYGKDNVFDTEELTRNFEVKSFLAPFVFCTRKSDNKDVMLEFIHSPRFYFDVRECKF